MKDKSAERVAVATQKTEESADRRTVLAANRTVFAAERTYAAWVRTGLAALASGVGAKAVLGHVMNEQLVLAAGSVLALFSAFCFGAAVWRELIPGPPPPQPDVRSLPPVLPRVERVSCSRRAGCARGHLLVALAALAGILFARTPGQ